MDLSSASCSPANSPPLKHDPLPEEATPGPPAREVPSPGPPAEDVPSPGLPAECVPSPSPPARDVPPPFSSYTSPPPIPSSPLSPSSPPASIVMSIDPSTTLSCDNISWEATPPTTVSDKSSLEDVSLHISSTSIIPCTTPPLSDKSSPPPRENGSISDLFTVSYDTNQYMTDSKGNEAQDEPKAVDEVQNERKLVDEAQNELRSVHEKQKETILDVPKLVDKQPTEPKPDPQAKAIQKELVLVCCAK